MHGGYPAPSLFFPPEVARYGCVGLKKPLSPPTPARSERERLCDAMAATGQGSRLQEGPCAPPGVGAGLCVVSGTTSDPGRPRTTPVRSPESRAVGRKARAGVPALQLAAGCTHDEPTPQPTPHLEGLVILRHQEAAGIWSYE